MGHKFTITIEVEGGTHNVVVRDDAGNEKKCNSVVITAGDRMDGSLYTFAWGHPKDAAWSLGEGMARSQGKEWWDSFIMCHLKDMVMRSVPKENISVQDLMQRWDKEDEQKKLEADQRKREAH